MKKIGLFLLLIGLLTACKDSIEEQAQVHYQLASQAYAKGAYDVARSEVDSIRLLFPKAIQTRKEALQLRLKIDLAEGQLAVEQADQIIQKKIFTSGLPKTTIKIISVRKDGVGASAWNCRKLCGSSSNR